MKIFQTCVIVTPHWLIWATDGAKTKAAVLSVQLRNITVQDHAQTAFAKMVPDSSIEVSRIFTDASESANAFLGLDESVTGKKFRDLVVQTAQDAKK